MIHQFNSKKEIFDYILTFSKLNSDLVLIRGSTAKGNVKKFSDFDVEIYGQKEKFPYYEICLLKKKVILITIYFRKNIKGNKINPPEKIKILKGLYTDKIQKIFDMNWNKKEELTSKQKINRECQLIVDFLFKFLRTGSEKHIKLVQERLKLK